MNLVINKKIYNLPHGIGLLKTLHGGDYNNLPEHFKHEEIKKIWDNYEGIPKKIYEMTQSDDVEMLELVIKLLGEKKYFKETRNIYGKNGFEEVLYKVKVFLTKDEEQWNNYK